MRIHQTAVLWALVALLAPAVFASGSSGSEVVTATVESSISLTVEASGGTTSGLGTDSASSDLGSISKFGSAPVGFSLARGGANWTLSSNVSVKVTKANLASPDYTLTVQLGSAPAAGITWKMNGSTLSDAAATTLTATGVYDASQPYSWDIVVADSASAAAIDNTLNFIATSN